MATRFTHIKDRYGFKRISKNWDNIYVCIQISPTGEVGCYIDIFNDNTQETYSYAKHDVGSFSEAKSCIRKICKDFASFRHLVVSNNVAMTKFIEFMTKGDSKCKQY